MNDAGGRALDPHRSRCELVFDYHLNADLTGAGVWLSATTAGVELSPEVARCRRPGATQYVFRGRGRQTFSEIEALLCKHSWCHGRSASPNHLALDNQAFRFRKKTCACWGTATAGACFGPCVLRAEHHDTNLRRLSGPNRRAGSCSLVLQVAEDEDCLHEHSVS